MAPTPRMSRYPSGVRRLALMALALIALVGGVPRAGAQPVIPPGQESRVLALLEPHGFGAEPVNGWGLAGVSIERSFVAVRVTGPEGAEAELRLLHPSAVDEPEERSPSFALERRGPTSEARRALEPWVSAVRTNDEGGFWEALPAVQGGSTEERSHPKDHSGAWLGPLGLGLGVVVVVLALAFLAGWDRSTTNLPTAPAERLGWVDLAMASGLGALAVGLLFLIATGPPLHGDTNRDLLLARDCLERGVCLGASTSFGGLEQHPGWVRFLAFLRGLGLGPVGAYRVVVVLDGLAVGAVFLLARRALRPATALFVAALALGALVHVAELPILWNPSLAPMAWALLYAGVLGGTSPWLWALGGLGAAFAMETHVAGVIGLAPLVLGASVLARRPGLAVALGLGLFAAVEVACSGEALASNLSSPVARYVVLPTMVAGLGALALLGRWLRHRLPPAFGRRQLAVAALTAVLTTGPPLVATLAAGHYLQARYFAAAVVPLALLVGHLVDGLRSRETAPARLGAAAVAVAMLLGSLPWWLHAFDPHTWAMADVERVAEALDAERTDHGELRLRLRGPHTFFVGEALAAWAPGLRFEPDLDQPDLRLVRVPHAYAPPPGWRAQPLPSGAVALLGSIESWLQPARSEVCVVGSGEPECVRLDAGDWRAFGGERPTYERLASGILPALQSLRDRVGSEGDEPLTLFARVPVAIRGEDPRRTLQLFDDLGASDGWRFARVEGVGFRGELGGKRITLHSGAGSVGTITLEHSAPIGLEVRPPLLQLFEARPSDEALLDAVCAEVPDCPRR